MSMSEIKKNIAVHDEDQKECISSLYDFNMKYRLSIDEKSAYTRGQLLVSDRIGHAFEIGAAHGAAFGA